MLCEIAVRNSISFVSKALTRHDAHVKLIDQTYVWHVWYAILQKSH